MMEILPIVGFIALGVAIAMTVLTILDMAKRLVLIEDGLRRIEAAMRSNTAKKDERHVD